MNITLKQIESLAIEAIERLDTIIPYDLRKDFYLSDWHFKITNSVKIAGQCVYSTKTISISQKSPKTSSLKGLKNTIAHELLHAIFPAEGHRGNWKHYAGYYNLNQKFVEDTGEITRCYKTSDHIDESNLLNYKYKTTCTVCGVNHYYVRKSKYFNLKDGTTTLFHKPCGKDSNITVQVL